MSHDYPIRFVDQLRQHLRSLRKKRGLTQAQFGALVGVSQARIAEIEANPGLVGFEQMLQLLSALGVTLTLQEASSAPIAPDRSAASVPVKPGAKTSPSGTRAKTKEQARVSKAAFASSARPKKPRAPNPDDEAQPNARVKFIVTGAKKGSW